MKLSKPLFVVIVLLFAAVVFAGPGSKPNDMPMMPSGQPHVGPGMQPSILNFAVELDLAAAQVEKLISIEKISSVKMKESMKEMRKLMEQMLKETEKDSPDEKIIDQIINNIAENHKVFMKQRFFDMQQIKAVLTKEQQKKIKKLIEQGPGNMREHGKDFPEMP
jgi:Spy/CpxP family protein refolding chaperone